jgi:hypothetical protein
MKVSVVADTAVPFTVHAYAGVVPPFTGVAVNVLRVPAHTVSAGVVPRLTVTATVGVITTVAMLLISFIQPGTVVAVAVYVPAIVIEPKLKAQPVAVCVAISEDPL